MGRNALIDLNKLNELLTAAYNLGRENENRMERGIKELDPVEAFSDWVNKWLDTETKA